MKKIINLLNYISVIYVIGTLLWIIFINKTPVFSIPVPSSIEGWVKSIPLIWGVVYITYLFTKANQED